MVVRVQKWGNSLGVRIPKSIARQSGIFAGAELEILSRRGQLLLQPVSVPSLRQLVAQIKRSNRPDLLDWGSPTSSEMW